MKTALCTVGIVFLACVMGGGAHGDAGIAPVEDERWRVAFTETFGAENPREVHYVLEVEDRQRGERPELVVVEPLLTPEELAVDLRIIRGTTLVFQYRVVPYQPNAEGVILLDLETHETIDAFFGLGFALCPGERFWVFQRLIRPRPPSSSQSAVVLLYDMDRSPEENRLAMDGADPRIDAGFPVYPSYYAENLTYRWEEQLESEKPWYRRASPFLWRDNGREAVFLVTEDRGDAPETALVHLDFGAGVSQPQIRERRLDYQALADAAAEDRTEPGGLETPQLIHARALEWADEEEEQVRLKLDLGRDPLTAPLP